MRLAIAAILVIAEAGPVGAQEAVLVPTRPAPEFELERFDGGRLALRELRGRPVVINFWASWCAPCRTEMPDLINAWRANPGVLEILAVNLTDQERGKDVARFVAEFGVPFPVLLDVRGKVRELYSLTSLPTTVFVDSGGMVRTVHSGPLSGDALELGLRAILSPFTTNRSAPAEVSGERN